MIKENDNVKCFSGLSLKEELKTVLPEYMIPNALIKLKSMPLLVNGKIWKYALLHLSIKILNRYQKIVRSIA